MKQCLNYGVWEVTRCRDINGVKYEKRIPKKLFLQQIGVK